MTVLFDLSSMFCCDCYIIMAEVVNLTIIYFANGHSNRSWYKIQIIKKVMSTYLLGTVNQTFVIEHTSNTIFLRSTITFLGNEMNIGPNWPSWCLNFWRWRL